MHIRRNIRFAEYLGLSQPGGMCNKISGNNFRMSVNTKDTLIYLVNSQLSTSTAKVRGSVSRARAIFLVNRHVYFSMVNSRDLNFALVVNVCNL